MENTELKTIEAPTQAPGYYIASADDTKYLANDLAKFIRENKLFHNIQGKEYVNVEGWQYAGSRLGILPNVKKLIRIRNEKNDAEICYKAKISLIDLRTGAEVGTGYALCSNTESTKKYYQEFAIASMAQTRAIGKAYRNILAWIIRAAGYEPTPAEEMDYVAANPASKVDTTTGEITEPKGATRPTKGEMKEQTEKSIKDAGSMPVKTPETTAPQPITINQKTQILLLLNNSVFKQEEKEKMVAIINSLDTQKAEGYITKLKKEIKEREAAAKDPASEDQITLIRNFLKSHVFAEKERTKMEENITKGLSKANASTWIEYFKEEIKNRKEYEAANPA